MSAVSPCFYHSDRPGAGNCTECDQPLCLGCQMIVAGKTVCQPCVSAIRARIAGEIAPGVPATQSAPPPPPPQYAYAQSAADTGVYQPYAPTFNAPIESMGAKHVLGGLGLGFLAGLVGLVAWMEIASRLPFNLSLFAIGVAWLISIATIKGAGGRGGNVVALISAILAFILCGIGVLPYFFHSDPFGWFFGAVCLFYGVRRAYIMPIAASNHW